MNHSLIGANCATHFKIVALAIVGSALLGFAVHGSIAIHASNTAHASNIAYTIARPQLTESQSSAGVENRSVCRLTTL
jgi:hypothetical protein